MPSESHFTREKLRMAQDRRLETLVHKVLQGNAFYQSKFSTLRRLSGKRLLGSLTRDDFGQFPFTTKSEIVEDQRAHPPFGSNLTYPLLQYTRCHQTSGTHGTPIRWLDTQENWQWMIENWLAIYQAAGVTPADRLFFGFSFGPFLGFWTAFEAAVQLGCLCLPGGGLSSAARLRAIIEEEVSVLCCTPTYALHLTEVASRENISCSRSKVRLLIVAGEPGGSLPAVRRDLERTWKQARVFDHHGMTEVGPVTYECPSRPGLLHILESAYIAEILEPGGSRSAPPGATGELVLTTLGRIGSPVIRYRTGDLVQAQTFDSAPCACGTWQLGLVGGILGRTDDMCIVRGVNVYPSAIEEIVRACGGIAEYQVRARRGESLTELEVHIEPDSSCAKPAILAQRLESDLQQALSLRVPVTVVPAGSLPRSEMKARRWITV